MDPYSILSQIGAINAQRATLVKQDGRRIELLVKPESGVSETVGGQTAPGAIAVRTWSTGADEKSVDLFPGAGDRLEIADESIGEILSYRRPGDIGRGDTYAAASESSSTRNTTQTRRENKENGVLF